MGNVDRTLLTTDFSAPRSSRPTSTTDRRIMSDEHVEDGRVTTATVLFCDLVGSTAQRTALGDDAADRLALVLDRLLRGAVTAWHGRVVKAPVTV